MEKKCSVHVHSVLEMGWYMLVLLYQNFLFLNFVPALTNMYSIHISYSMFLTAYICFTYKKYTRTFKFPFRALCTLTLEQLHGGLIGLHYLLSFLSYLWCLVRLVR
jgi:hypothetical protein